MKVKAIQETDGVSIGAVNDRADSYWWLELGIAEPVDDEAKEYFAMMQVRNSRLKAKVERQAKAAMAAHLEEKAAAEEEKHAEFEAMLKEGL